MRILPLFGLLFLLSTGCFGGAMAVEPERWTDAVLVVSEELPHEGPPAVSIRRSAWRREYAVAGDDASSLRAALDRAGPYMESLGRRYDAMTAWGLRWTFRYRTVPAGCALAAATIELEDVILLPGHAAADALAPDLRERWLAYVEALETHEEEHVALHLAAALELQQRFADAPPASDCRALGEQLAAMGEAAIASIRAGDTALDRTTGHGATNGAVFP